MNYEMRVYQIETMDGLQWEADFIDVPECVGGGSTPEEAVTEAMENLKYYLEDLEAQDPNGFNYETILTLKDAMEGKNVSREFDSVEDMFKDMGFKV